jgi:DNA-directed RNA polymerase subunit beta
MVKGEEIPAPTVPESFKVLVRELNSLGVNVIPHEVEEIIEEKKPSIDDAASDDAGDDTTSDTKDDSTDANNEEDKVNSEDQQLNTDTKEQE